MDFQVPESQDMKLLLGLLLYGLLSLPVHAKHWHDDDSHWRQHFDHDDDRDYDHRAEAQTITKNSRRGVYSLN